MQKHCVLEVSRIMSLFNTILILSAAFLAVFGEATLDGLRHWLGAQVDLLPALMVYTALKTNLTTVSLLAVSGGLWFDTLSANPLGISILPLFVVGLVIWLQRELLLREVPFAQLFVGAVASAMVPALVVLLLLTIGRQPLLGWGSLWQWLVLTAGGAVATPVVFVLFDWCRQGLGYQPQIESSFRPDREIRRDRNVKIK
jgi:cell shape-determining protein MreD